MYATPAAPAAAPVHGDPRAADPAGQEQERKKQAGDSTNWNPFYVNQATVVEAVAEKLGVEKVWPPRLRALSKGGAAPADCLAPRCRVNCSTGTSPALRWPFSWRWRRRR